MGVFFLYLKHLNGNQSSSMYFISCIQINQFPSLLSVTLTLIAVARIFWFLFVLAKWPNPATWPGSFSQNNNVNNLCSGASKHIFDFSLVTVLKLSSCALPVGDPLGSGLWCAVEAWRSRRQGSAFFLGFIDGWVPLNLWTLCYFCRTRCKCRNWELYCAIELFSVLLQ